MFGYTEYKEYIQSTAIKDYLRKYKIELTEKEVISLILNYSRFENYNINLLKDARVHNKFKDPDIVKLIDKFVKIYDLKLNNFLYNNKNYIYQISYSFTENDYKYNDFSNYFLDWDTCYEYMILALTNKNVKFFRVYKIPITRKTNDYTIESVEVIIFAKSIYSDKLEILESNFGIQDRELYYKLYDLQNNSHIPAPFKAGDIVKFVPSFLDVKDGEYIPNYLDRHLYAYNPKTDFILVGNNKVAWKHVTSELIPLIIMNENGNIVKTAIADPIYLDYENTKPLQRELLDMGINCINLVRDF